MLPLCFPFLLGTGLALAAEPAVRLLCDKLGLPRAAASGIGVTAVFLGITTVTLFLLAVLVRELRALAGILPDLTRTAQSGVSLLQNRLLDLAARMPQSVRPLARQNVTALFSGGSALLDKAFSWGLGLAGTMISHVPDSALNFGTAVISGYMISAKLPGIRHWLRERISGDRLKSLIRNLKRIRKTVGDWLLAQLRLTGVTFVILLLGMVLLRIPYGVLWAVGICLLDALPVLGTGIVLLPWSLICYLQSDRARAIGLVSIYVVITVARSVLEPKLVGKQLGLDPLVTLVAIYIGYRLWGLGGMIIAPVLAVIVVRILPENRKK